MVERFKIDIEAVQNIPAVPKILEVICRTTGMGFAAVARVTEHDWVACQVLDNVHFGIVPGGELKIETTLCNDVRIGRKEIAFDDVREDPVYANHPAARIYGLQSYISAPIALPDGTFFGTLCAVDAQPARVNNEQIISMFKLFAEMIAYHLDANQKLTESRAVLANERALAELREQFIAVLGHDLRNPVASIAAGASVLAKEPLSAKGATVIKLMKGSADRMAALINDTLDFARGRMGGGFAVNREAGRPIGPTLQQVLAEIRSSHPDRSIEGDVDLDAAVQVDLERIAQLLSNLLGNAISHGDPATPIRVRASLEGGFLELAVSNGGEPIPPAIIGHLFEPYTRGKSRPGQQGLGLGLYIASQIAIAHGGFLDVVSTAEETTFTFRMPV